MVHFYVPMDHIILFTPKWLPKFRLFLATKVATGYSVIKGLHFNCKNKFHFHCFSVTFGLSITSTDLRNLLLETTFDENQQKRYCSISEPIYTKRYISNNCFITVITVNFLSIDIINILIIIAHDSKASISCCMPALHQISSYIAMNRTTKQKG